MREPEIALVFTPEPWVDRLHRSLADHGGARVRSIVVEPSVALEESYDVLVVSHRWPGLTHAFVADVHARGSNVLGVHDLAEPASRLHLDAVGADASIDDDADTDAFVRAITALTAARPHAGGGAPAARGGRRGRLVVVGGPPGAGRTEVAIELARALSQRGSAVLVDCDDVAPAVAARLGLPVEPGLRGAIDAVEHGHGDLASCVVADRRAGIAVLTGLASAAAWSQVRAGEVLRVVDRLAGEVDAVVADGAGCLADLAAAPRGRFATARALVAAADAIVAVCDATPVGVAHLLGWVVEARRLAPAPPLVVVVNRAPRAAFRRAQLYDEISSSIDAVEVGFAAADDRVADAAWCGGPVARGRFTRGVAAVAEVVGALGRRPAALVEVAG